MEEGPESAGRGVRMAAMNVEVIADVGRLLDVRDEWDALVVAAGTPMAAPAWTIPWLRHAAPAGARAHVIAVREEERLVGLAPLLVRRDSGACAYETLGERFLWRVAPLAAPGRAWDVAQASWNALLALRPAPDIVRMRSASPGEWFAWWHVAHLAEPGTRAPLIRHGDLGACPYLSLDGDFESWFASRSANFRSEMRRARRRFAEAGGSVRASSHATVAADLETYVRLHMARWEGGRTSGLAEFGEALRPLLGEMAQALPPERLRLYVAELDGEPIGAQLFTGAGRVSSFHNSGWDPRHSRLKPGLVGMLHAVEQAFSEGFERLDFGPGDYAYKLRFSSGDEPVLRTTFFLPSARLGGAVALRSSAAAGRMAAAAIVARRRRSAS